MLGSKELVLQLTQISSFWYIIHVGRVYRLTLSHGVLFRRVVTRIQLEQGHSLKQIGIGNESLCHLIQLPKRIWGVGFNQNHAAPFSTSDEPGKKSIANTPQIDINPWMVNNMSIICAPQWSIHHIAILELSLHDKRKGNSEILSYL